MNDTQHIDFGDPRSLADLGTYLGRASRANPDGAVRLQVLGNLLLTTVAVIEGTGLMGDGTVLGMRVVAIAASDDVDATVSFASVNDRLAREGNGAVLSVPPTTVRAPWSGLTPPRDGWEPVGQLRGDAIESIARQGISQIAEGTPANAGGHAVESLRRRTWGAMSDTVPPIAAGLAFGAHVLGFASAGESATISAHGRWTRLTTSRGHVLVR
ncbi:hypothetical protein [Terrabacter carboxydivorans]|uniref:Uncharacterized protein n=1 Tax=Terrabacter carboxydivorans TaxID=619730 RepID=A0ABN3LNS5_9MICO